MDYVFQLDMDKLKGAVGTNNSPPNMVTDPYHIQKRLNELPPNVTRSSDNSNTDSSMTAGDGYGPGAINKLDLSLLSYITVSTEC